MQILPYHLHISPECETILGKDVGLYMYMYRLCKCIKNNRII